MIQNVSNATQAPLAAPADQTSQNPGSVTYHTPFGDVLVDQLVEADFSALFGGGSTPQNQSNPAVATPAAQPVPPPPAAPTADNSVPTAESVFGSDPWVAKPTGTGPDGAKFGVNPYYFATRETAAEVAAMVGGTVVEKDAYLDPSGRFVQDQPNEMVQVADGGLINPGIVASFFTHGYSQSVVDQMILNEVKGA